MTNLYVLVDPYVTSGYWYRTIAKMDLSIKTVAVWSSDEIKKELSKSVTHNIVADYDFIADDSTIEKIKSIGKVIAVLPCYDSSIDLVDKLQNALTPDLSSDPALAHARTGKWPMYKHLHSLGLIGKSSLISSGQVITDSTYDGEAVIKPLKGSGGSGVSIRTGLDSINAYLASSPPDQSFILQKRHIGDEYAVDMLTYNGDHKLMAVWRYTKEADTHVKEEVDLINPSDDPELIKRISNYVKTILTAIGFGFGPSHTEVIVDRQSNVNVIEVNLRLHGHLDEGAVDKVLPKSQIKGTFYIAKNRPQITCNDTYPVMKPLKKIYVNNRVPKYIDRINWTNLKSYIQKNFHIVYERHLLFPGHLDKTSCVADSLGVILMVGNDLSRWEEDVNRAREWKNRIVWASESSLGDGIFD